MNNIKCFLVVQLLFSFCLCELNNDQKEKFLNGFIEHYNSLPNQVYKIEESSWLSTQQEDDTTYHIVVKLRVAEINNVEATKLLKCIATIKDSDNVVTVLNSLCENAVEQVKSPDENPEPTAEAQVEVTEPNIERKPVKLDNEVQADIAITSGEQFIAIPRQQPSAPCVGCASHVNPQAAGVSDLANLGVRHLDLHEPSVKHTLDSVKDVERQVQVVNGVRYILTISINFNNCTEVETENCAFNKICKITILMKPWVKLSNGGNYKSILANNCTEEWLYGEDGEVLPELSPDNSQITRNSSVNPGDINNFDDNILVKHNTNVESQPNQGRPLTNEDIIKIQEQIITNAEFQEVTESYREAITISPDPSTERKQHVFKVESEKSNENSIPVTESEKAEQQDLNINPDKKKVIDEMLDFLEFSGFKPKTEADEGPRVKRSYDYDLQVLSLAEDFRNIKKSVNNARFIYEMAQAMVDYLNEMDMEVKNRAIKNIIRAESETEHLQRFVYIQASVKIPCDNVECELRGVTTQICNGVIDCSNENSPQILNTFCYNDDKASNDRENIREISLKDPVLRRMAEDAVKKIEYESKSEYALRINKIVSAINQVTSGTLTKFSVIIENINCNKSVPWLLRKNCTVLVQLGSKICDVLVHEKHWLKEKKISYICTDRPTDMRISKNKIINKNVTVNDPRIIEMLQEAIQYLESQSDKTNKQKIVTVNSISSQIIAGFLTKIEFVVGFTNCTDVNYSRDRLNKCELLKDATLRSCKTQIWDRSWIMEGRQIEVSCDDVAQNNEIVNTRKRRSVISTSDQELQSKSKNNDLEYKKLAKESLNKFMRSTSSNQHYEVVKIDKAIVQDESKKFIKIDFSISPTNCLIKNDGILSSSKCNIVNPENVLHCRSKILVNNWIDKNQYFVRCNIKYQHQNNINGLQDRDPSDSKYYQLAEESLTKYLHDTGNPNHIIVQIEKVTTQVVSGLITRIDFVVSPKNQSDSNSKIVLTRCHSEILEKHWMGTKTFNVSCQMNKSDEFVKININNPKYMHLAVDSLQKYIKNKPESNLVRVTFVDKVIQEGKNIRISFIASQAEEGDGDTFCYTVVSETRQSEGDIDVKCYYVGIVFRKTEITEDDPNYYKYVHLADESLRNYIEKMNSSHYTLISIESITVQWDEGFKTIINFTISPIDTENSELIQGKQCISKILEQPWLHKKNIDVKCELEKDLYRTKRQVPGGEVTQDPAKPEYKALAEQSLQKYAIDAGITVPLQVTFVEQVTTQVVAGSMTRIDFLGSGSPDAKSLKCRSEIWEQSWRAFKQINVICHKINERVNRDVAMPGGEVTQDPAKPEYKALAEESLQKYAIDAGITAPLQVTFVERVTTQVVAGSMTRIDFLGSGGPDAKSLKCRSEIWEQSWRAFKQITVTCRKINERVKRDVAMPGGEVTQDPAKPEYKALAEESLQKYAIDAGITAPLQVTFVERVTTQVVAGSMTRIDFLGSGSPDAKSLKCRSEIWEQSWRAFKQINVICHKINERVNRDVAMPGGEVTQDPAKPEYKALAEESLQKYAIDAGITAPLQVTFVERVTTQVVAGSMTRIDFLGSGGPDAKSLKCRSEIWEQSWRAFKQITVTCRKINERVKRDVAMPGGEVTQDPAKPEYKALAEESLQKYAIDAGITAPLQVTFVERVTTQVVAGSMTRIDFLGSGSPDAKSLKCRSEIWEQSWRAFKQINVICHKINERVNRDVAMPGGEVTQDPAKPEYKALAEESLQKYAIDAGITAPLQVTFVERVTTQVVAGSMTRIDFLGSGGPDAKSLKCRSEIWEQSWRAFKQITVTCRKINERVKRDVAMPGGEVTQDPAKPEYKALAEESLQKYAIDAGITAPLQVTFVERVTTQVVAGSMTRIDFLGSGGPDAKSLKCRSEIWEQSWRAFKQITVTCRKINERVKRDVAMPGGEVTQDPAKPEYKALAEESLQKYAIDAGITAPLQVTFVERVTTQVVAGSMTRIDFLGSGSPDAKSLKCRSEIWEQSWRAFKQINVICHKINERVNRDVAMPGGEVTQDPAKPEYKALAEESLQKYAIDAGITAPLQVTFVERVTTQVVAGSMTRIDFLGSGGPDAKSLKCRSEIWEQSWRAFKQITVTCRKINERVKRDVAMPGGEVTQDPAKPEYKALAEESLQKYAIDAGITAPLQVTFVERVTTQVVAGSMTRIDFLGSGSPDAKSLKCRSEIWEQSWRGFKQINVTCHKINERVNRAVAMPGGEVSQDPSKPEYKALAEESLQKYAIDAGTTAPLQVVLVEKVITQVVAGYTTRIEFLVSSSPDATTLKCVSKVWERSWLKNRRKEIDVSCQKDGHRDKRQIPGQISDEDPTDPQYRALAEESLKKYIMDFEIVQSLEVVHVERVTKQLVGGSLTRLDFLISFSQDSKLVKCHSEVWDRPWLNSKKINVSCQNNGHRGKRQVNDGFVDQDPTELQYKALAKESLLKYVFDAGITAPLEVALVEKVATQVDSGILIHIDFLVHGSPNSEILKCHSKVWNRPWLNSKEIHVSCHSDDHRGKTPGGLSDQDPTKRKYQKLAEQSLQKYIKTSGISQPLEVVKVQKVTTQIAGGLLTHIDFVVSGDCDSTTIICHSKILEKNWLNHKDIDVSCSHNGHRRIDGGFVDQDPTEPQYKVMAEESLQKYVVDSGTTQPLEVERIERVITQVVSGIPETTGIDFTVSGSYDSKKIKCHTDVQLQPWLNIKKMEVSCHNDGHRRKIHNSGGIIDQDSSKPQYKALAEESLRQYIIDAGITLPLEVAHVEKVTTQVISGTLTRIDFMVSGSADSVTFKCHSEVWDRSSLKQKNITVACLRNDERVKRDLTILSSPERNLKIPQFKVLTTEWIQKNNGKRQNDSLRGHGEEEQDPNKLQYKLLAEESLRKLYQKKSTIYHKVVEVNRVFTRVVSGLKYYIDFTAAPTTCSVNVSSVRARSCKADGDVILYCHSEIWDRPWLKQKKIDVQCNDPNDDNDDTTESVSDNNLSIKYTKLAEEASEKYLTTSNRKYVHKVTEILNATEKMAGNDSLIYIVYSLSPTTCLRNETTNNTSCQLKQPLVVFNCSANIRIHVEKEIQVTCKKNSETNSKKRKRELGVIRNIRQVTDDDEEIDEDTTYYYADRAVQHVNDRSHSNNLHKLITIHAVQSSVQMGTLTIKMYIEIGETYCLRHQKVKDLRQCEEMSGLNHRLCLARLWPSPDDELVVRHVSVVCDDDHDFISITGVDIGELVKIAVVVLENNPDNKFKLVHQGEPQVIPSLDSRRPFKLNFVIGVTNCSKDVNLDQNPFQCYLNPNVPSRNCHAFIWLKAETKYISNIDAQCTPIARFRRSALDPEHVTLDYSEIQNLVAASLEKLEMQSLHRYKQRVLQINSHSTKITSGKVTTIDFDVGYTTCLKYEWVANITSCNFLEHLPRRRCVAQIWERLWINNGKNIDVNCVDDETPLESHIEFESAEMANELARQALKHIEAKYPHPSKQKIVRIFSLEKQVVAGIHYKMKVEVGFTDCLALTDQKVCNLVTDHGLNKFCRINVWLRPWTDHPPNFRVACDFQEGATHDMYLHVQAEHLFYNFLTTYNPSYINNYSNMHKRFEIFKNNIKKIHEFNVHDKGTAVYGVTRFTDLTYEEFRTTYMGLNTNLTNENQVPLKQADIPNIKVPANFDWREYDAVTEVKDQGSCGSCWAFSVTGNIEGQWKMQSGQLVSLSEQELVDCDKLDDGCSGGLPDNAYRAIEQMGGLELESDYPYEGTDDKCSFNKTLAKVQISSAVNITTNETGMAQWLVHNGPISIGINANAMQFYMGGISHPWKMLCNPTNLDHGVLIVGYGVKEYPLFNKKMPFWIVKNSWGKSWGEQGYYRVYRGDGTCGVNQMASSAVI